MSDEEIRATDGIKPPVVVRAMNLIEQQSDARDIETQVGFSDELRPSRRCLEHLQATKNEAKFSRNDLLITGKVGPCGP